MTAGCATVTTIPRLLFRRIADIIVDSLPYLKQRRCWKHFLCLASRTRFTSVKLVYFTSKFYKLCEPTGLAMYNCKIKYFSWGRNNRTVTLAGILVKLIASQLAKKFTAYNAKFRFFAQKIFSYSRIKCLSEQILTHIVTQLNVWQGEKQVCLKCGERNSGTN